MKRSCLLLLIADSGRILLPCVSHSKSSPKLRSSRTWESRLPKIVEMLDNFKADIICLQEVSCSNANRTEHPNTEKVICNEGLRGMILNCFKDSFFLAEDPDDRDREFKTLTNILKGNFPIPNTIDKSWMNKFYTSSCEHNVKAIIVKKLKIQNKATGGLNFYVLAVIKCGKIMKNCKLKYVEPHLPIFVQKKSSLRIQRIIKFHQEAVESNVTPSWGSCLHGVRTANLREVDSIQKGTEPECVALLEVIHSFQFQTFHKHMII
jgi:hypothetical protein